MTVYAKAAVVHNDEKPYLTAGKEYEVVRNGGYDTFFIIDDEGDEIHCCWDQCPHLEYHNWERIER